MRRLSKIAGVALAGTLVLSACGGGSGSGSGGSGSGGGEGEAEGSEDICATSDGDGPRIGMAYDVGGRGDRSFNDSAYVGLERAVDELDATCIEAVAGTEENDNVRAERLRTLAEEYDLVIGVGFLYSPAAAEVAPEYPDVSFAVIDGFTAALTGGEVTNLADLGFAEQEGSYLVGMAAALQSESGQIGFVGGVPSPLIQRFEAGYVAGAESIDPEIEVEVAYLTEDEADSETAFANPPGGRNAATPMYEGGADVVYHAAGSSGSGVFEAAAAAGEGNWAIGVDSDQYLTAPEDQQPFILTSMLKRIDTAVFEVTESVANDAFEGGSVVYDLSVDGVGYSDSGGFVDDYADQLDEAAEQIASGEIEVPAEPQG